MNVNEGDIFVIISIDKDMIFVIEKVVVLVVEEGGLISYVVVVGVLIGIFVIVGVNGVIVILKNG